MAIPARVSCCIAGGGPAGMVLGYLLARAGVDVCVLEKHADFLRDFRGDTIHPSTLEIMFELGLLEEFLQRPHQELRELRGEISGQPIVMGDFTHVPTHCKFLAFMPQWDFLNFVSEKAKAYSAFHLAMETSVVDLIERDGRITGVIVDGPDGRRDISADLVVGADGRHSIVRDRAKLIVDDFGVPIDVLWMRLSRHAGDENQPLGRVASGRIFVTIDRGDYWQCALVIAKGGYEAFKAQGLDALRKEIVRVAPQFVDRVGELTDWDQVSLLTVKVDRLRQWARPGLVCIGDAAHAMSPVGGVGINLAIQDAVAAANILVAPLRAGGVTIDVLNRIQRRREWPTRVTQRGQMLIQNMVISRVLRSHATALQIPLPIRLLQRFPYLRRFPARFIGLGVRPEHVSAGIRSGRG